MSAEFKAPFWCHDSRWAWLLDDISELEEVEKKYLESEQLKTVKILDRNLNFFEVSELKVLSKAGVFGWKPGYKGTYFNVELTLSFVERFGIEKAKIYIRDFVSIHPEIYESSTGVEGVIMKLNKAKNSNSLFAAL